MLRSSSLVASVSVGFFIMGAWVQVAAQSPQQGQPAARQFASAGLTAVINRATPPNKQGTLAVSVVITNVRDDVIEMMTHPNSGPLQAVTDSGHQLARSTLSGLVICNATYFEACGEAVDNQKLRPTALDGKQSMLITIAFDAPRDTKICSLDFSLPLYVRTNSGKNSSSWRQTTIGVPNITVC